MNLRMSAGDKKIFDRFCRQNGLKSREAMGLLLDQITGEDTHRDQLLSAQQKLRAENSKLKERLALQSGKADSPREQRQEACLGFLLPGLTDYLLMLFPKPEGDALPTLPYKRFRQQTETPYEYPREEGFYLLTAEVSLWGRNRARFVIGRGEQGELLRFRWYPKPDYAGLPVWDYSAGTRWVVGCRRSADGAMELVASFPLPPAQQLSETEPMSPAPERKPSLLDQIRKAEAQQ